MQNNGTHSVAASKPPRSSNLELYRILCMLLIVAHHFVVNSGLTSSGGPLMTNHLSVNSIFLSLFGAWGKTGINCFLMITGYFMCTNKITVRKFLKLMGQVYLYRFVIFAIFLLAGRESITPQGIIKLVMPFWNIGNGFMSCFIVFWLSIPFLSILVQNMNQRQHQLLLILTLGVYTICGSIPGFAVTFNYVSWFGVIFFIASYIRLYPHRVFERGSLWGWLTLLSFALAVASIIGLQWLFGDRVGLGYNFVADSNKFFAVAIAVCSFLWFKNMNLKYSKVINAIGAATFGVLLIHANSYAMRQWLWKDTLDVVGHYTLPIGKLVLYSFGVVLAVFIICNLIDQLRIATVEKWFFNWYDKRMSAKADALVNKILQKQ